MCGPYNTQPYPTFDMFSKTVTTVLATVGSRYLDNSISAATSRSNVSKSN